MTVEEYMPSTTDRNRLLSHVVEECAKVTKIAMKIQRFGWDSHHPDTPLETNIDKLKEELGDLKRVIDRFETGLISLGR